MNNPEMYWFNKSIWQSEQYLPNHIRARRQRGTLRKSHRIVFIVYKGGEEKWR